VHELRTALRSGQHVEVRGEPWLVLATEPYEHVTLVTLRGLGDGNLGETQSVLEPFDRVHARRQPTRLIRATRRRVLLRAAEGIASSPAWNDCWTAAAAKIDLRSFQLEPALAAIRGATRILLADEVGLGKTIQAALIVAELLARGLAQRVLVLTPASIRHQWAGEMSDRFGLNAVVFDHSTMSATMARLPAGINPWSTAPVIVSSIDLVKRPEIRLALDAVAFDVLVVDEAHHLTPGTDRGAVVADLAARTPWVVLATATPHSGDEHAYRFLHNIGAVGDEEGLVLFRRGRAELRALVSRRVRTLAVQPTREERSLLDASMAYARAIWQRTAPSTEGLRLVAALIARRAASSAEAVKRTLERRLALLGGAEPEFAQASLPWDEVDEADGVDPDGVLGIPALPDSADERAWLEHLIQLANAAAHASSKVAVIRRVLRRTDEHLIVFSEYRDAIEAIALGISDLAGYAMLHGGLSPPSRQDAIHQFTHGGVRVLLATDAAGEGLNLHAQCRYVVNLELPWNPLRLEQRIGRVDRLGQSRRVHALHLVLRDSFEETVLARLERRRANAARGLSAPTEPFEAQIAATIFEGRPPPSWLQPSPEEGRSAAVDYAAGAARSRRLWAMSQRTTHRASASLVYALRARGCRVAAGIVLLFVFDLVDGRNRFVQRQFIAVDVHHSREFHRRLTKQMVVDVASCAEVKRVLEGAVADGVMHSHAAVWPLVERLERRVLAIVDVLDQRSRNDLVQASLFDKRAERQAQVSTAASQNMRQYFAQRLEAIRALQRTAPTGTRLVAAWLR